jgi:HSP20 family protein
MVRELMRRTEPPQGSIAPVSRMIDQFFEDPFLALTPMAVAREMGSLPLDLSEDENNYIVRASLPGFAPDDVNVEMDENILTITATKEEEETNERFHRRERRWGSVQRQIVLPVPVKDERLEAELNEGVLTLKLPKVQKAPPKKIHIGEPKNRRQTLTQGRETQAHHREGQGSRGREGTGRESPVGAGKVSGSEGHPAVQG